MTDENNPWKYVARRDVSNNPYFKKETQEVKADDTLPEKDNEVFDNSTTPKIIGVYSIIEDNPYAKTVHKLQKALSDNPNNTHPKFTKNDNSKIYRQLTFKENIEARVNDYETLNGPDGNRSDEERTKLFKVYFDSCTGFAYKAGTTKFKINPICQDLIIIDKGFNEEFKTIKYDSFKGTEFDSANDKYKYNGLLTKSQFLEHEAYRFLYDNDKKLMENYWNIVSTLTKKDKLMSLWVRQNTAEDELRALYVDGIDGDSDAGGGNFLNLNARFLLVAPSQKKSGKK